MEFTKFIDSDDELIEDLFFITADEEADEKNKRKILNKDGTYRKVKRLDYTRILNLNC